MTGDDSRKAKVLFRCGQFSNCPAGDCQQHGCSGGGCAKFDENNGDLVIFHRNLAVANDLNVVEHKVVEYSVREEEEEENLRENFIDDGDTETRSVAGPSSGYIQGAYCCQQCSSGARCDF